LPCPLEVLFFLPMHVFSLIASKIILHLQREHSC
jgi:hypothetical protein